MSHTSQARHLPALAIPRQRGKSTSEQPKFRAVRYDVRSQRAHSVGSAEASRKSQKLDNREHSSACPSPTTSSSEKFEQDKDFADKMASDILFVVKDREVEWNL